MQIKCNQSKWLKLKKIKKIQNTEEATSAGEDVEKTEPQYTVGGNANWCNHCGIHYGAFSKY